MIYYKKKIFKYNENKESFSIGSQNKKSQDKKETITITKNNFYPKTINIDIGNTIVWHNTDKLKKHKIRIFKGINTIHTTPDIFHDAETEFIFNKNLFSEGTYNYESIGNNIIGVININNLNINKSNNKNDCNIEDTQSKCLKNNKCKFDFKNKKCIYKNIPLKNNLKNNSKNNLKNTNISTQQKIKDEDPIPILKLENDKTNYNMSSFDGLCINTGNEDSWRKSPNNLPLIDDNDLYTLQGHNAPLKPIISDYNSLYGPPIDGDENSSKKLFMFANNLSSPSCCPSTFTTSTGCICTSKKQRDFVISRGNNIPKNNYEDIS
tara:strand:+ start:864 stop:1829 length:966 start_codon:yes stop_codon:yes gene_type:complete